MVDWDGVLMNIGYLIGFAVSFVLAGIAFDMKKQSTGESFSAIGFVLLLCWILSHA